MGESSGRGGSPSREEDAAGEPGLAPLRARVIFLAVTALYWMTLYFYVPILAPYAEFQGGTLRLVGLVVSAYGLAQLLLRIPLGIASDRIGRRKPFLALGFLTSALACVGFIYAPGPWLMVGMRFVSGISACAWVAFTVLFASYFPPGKTTQAMGTITLCNTLSVMSATAIGGRLADVYGWTGPFWASAGVGVLGLLALPFVYERRRRRPAAQPSLDRLRSVVRYPELVLAAIVAAMGQYVNFASNFGFLSNYAVTIGASKTELGFLVMAGMLAGSLAIPVSSHILAPRLGPRVMVVGAFASIAFATAAIPFIEVVGLLYVSQVLAGFGRGTAYPLLMGLAIARLPDAEKATAMGFFQGVYAIGMFAGPVVAGAIGSQWGYPTLFLTTGAVAVVTMLVALRLPREAGGGEKAD